MREKYNLPKYIDEQQWVVHVKRQIFKYPVVILFTVDTQFMTKSKTKRAPYPTPCLFLPSWNKRLHTIVDSNLLREISEWTRTLILNSVLSDTNPPHQIPLFTKNPLLTSGLFRYITPKERILGRLTVKYHLYIRSYD